MRDSNLKEFNLFLKELIDDERIKTIEITGWKEMGEFQGDIIKPMLKIVKFEESEKK